MTFINKLKFMFKKSDNNIVLFNIDNNLQYELLDNNLNQILSNNVFDGSLSYVNCWFDINRDDTIDGIIDNNNGKMINIKINNDIITDSTLFKYDYKNFIIKFPYIKIINDEKHIIYFSINKENKYFSQLIHIYIKDDVSIKNKIDIINYNIMSNFIVTWNNNIPTIFYFNRINGFEELFASTFDYSSLKWRSPLKLTNTKRKKIYLDVVNNSDNIYHIVFSECYDFKYHCKYLKLTLDKNYFKVDEFKTINNNIMCLFPSIIYYGSTLAVQWVEYNSIYTSKSNDLGMSWDIASKNNYISDYLFLRYYYKSNFEFDNKYKSSYIFNINQLSSIDNVIQNSIK